MFESTGTEYKAPCERFPLRISGFSSLDVSHIEDIYEEKCQGFTDQGIANIAQLFVNDGEPFCISSLTVDGKFLLPAVTTI
jgi:hypothetical protein